MNPQLLAQLQSLLPNLLKTGTSALTNLVNPQSLVGAGLLAGGFAADKEPGEVTQARQFLRNQFTSPNAFGDLMKQNVGNAQTALNPLLTPGPGQNFLTGQLSPTNTANILQPGPGQQYTTQTFQDPQAIANRFSGQVGALSQQFQPLLDQQRQRGISDIQQKFAAAFPTVGAQGPEFGRLARYITDEALPREQALLGNLGLEGLNAQE